MAKILLDENGKAMMIGDGKVALAKAGSATITKLWYNANAGDENYNFAAQQIELSDSMANYDVLRFTYLQDKWNAASQFKEWNFADVNRIEGGFDVSFVSQSSSTHYYISRHLGFIDATHIDIAGGFSNQVAHNEYLIPCAIYGIKYN